MRTFLKIGVLLVTFGALASSPDPAFYQYWFDKDESSRMGNTHVFNADSNPLAVDASGLSEGGHAINYRMADKDKKWGSVMTRYFVVPSTPDPSTSKAKAYRVWVNNNVVASGTLPTNSNFSIYANLPSNPSLGSVNKRDFTYLAGEDSIKMTATGKFTCAFQMLSENSEWGMPLYEDYDHSLSFKMKVDSVPVPCDYNFKKTDNNTFKAYRFTCSNTSELYFKASQECSMSLYCVETSSASNLTLLNTFTLKKEETTKYSDSNLSKRHLVAILYDTKKNATNRDDEVFLRIMYENNKLPKPEISFNNATWEVTLSCADQRAKIYYTLDGNRPTSDNEKRLEYNGPFKLDQFTKVQAIAVYGDLADSDMEELLISDKDMIIPKPNLEYVGGIEMNEFIFTNSIEGVKTYYVLGNYNIEDGKYRIEFDGTPIKIPDGTFVRARSEKEKLTSSEIFEKTVRHSEYITATPSKGTLNGDKNNKEMTLNVPEGTAYYRILPGKHDFGQADRIEDEEWNEYVKDSWLTIDGNMTVQAYATVEGKARSRVASIFTDWVLADKPEMEYSNYKLKLSTSMPGGKIYYCCIDPFDETSVMEYVASDLPEGVDMTEIPVVYAFVMAEGYSRSELLTVYRDNFNLEIPKIVYNDNDGVLDISHSDSGAELIVKIDPEQEYETVASNHIRFSPMYGTNVSAYARKTGFNDSGLAKINAIERPVIHINEYTVSITGEGDIYYTIDGTLPTKDSSPYNRQPFESRACTIRAAAFKNGYIPSEAISQKVMDPTSKPNVIIDNGFAKLSSITPNAKIYYSLDQSISNSSRKEYDSLSKGIDIESFKFLEAYAEAEGYRRSDTIYYKLSDHTLTPPTLRYKDGYVVAAHDDKDVMICFTDATGTPLISDLNSPRRVEVEYNSEVYAYSYKEGYVNSETVYIGHTTPPEISLDLFTVTISSKPGQSIYYTTDGVMPTTKSTMYVDTPFKISGDCVVRAVAFEDDIIPAEATPLSIGYRKCQTPHLVSYDGRFATFMAESGVKLRYVTDDKADILKGTEVAVGEKIDLVGLNTIRIIAQLSGADDSDELSYTPDYYADDTDAYTSKPGVLSEAFGWSEDHSMFESLKIHGTLNANSESDSGDYRFISSMPALKHLDLSDVTDVMVPDSAFAVGKLVSVTLPKTLKYAGKGIFGKENSTLCAVTLPSEDVAPAHLLEGVVNSNLLLYAKNKTRVDDIIKESSGIISNIVVIGGLNGIDRADEIKLSHARPFFAPSEFTASKISYSRSFTKETPIGGLGSGWETLVLPFDVQNVTSDGRSFKTFDDESADYHFWLFKADDTEWSNATTMIANVPYLLAFPNHPYYAEEYCVNGEVVFSSTNVNVHRTPDKNNMTFSFGTGRNLIGNYEYVGKEKDVLALNEDEITYLNRTYLPGGLFVSGQKDIVPFECYVESPGARAIPVFDKSAIDDLMSEYGTHIWSENYSICIRSAIAMKLRIYDMVGQLIRVVDVKAGETVRVNDITPGIYFVGRTKLLVKG